MRQHTPWLRVVLLAGTGWLAACEGSAGLNAAERAWEALEQERGDTYSWVHRDESIFDESRIETTHVVEDGELLRRVVEFLPGLHGGERRTEEHTTPQELEGGLSTIPSWHANCRRILKQTSPLRRVRVDLDEDGLVLACEAPGESSVEISMVGVTFE